MVCDMGYFEERDAAKVIKQLVMALHWCYERGIAHRDLKAPLPAHPSAHALAAWMRPAWGCTLCGGIWR